MGRAKSECKDKNCNVKEPTIKEVDQRWRCIMSNENDKEKKRQELLRLSESLGLPKHSADMHCIPLTYSQASEQIQKWIQNKRQDRYTILMVLAACCSAFAALCSLVVSIISIWHQIK